LDRPGNAADGWNRLTVMSNHDDQFITSGQKSADNF
jgi:hypothetical protein